jgi:two-component system response regulator DesR
MHRPRLLLIDDSQEFIDAAAALLKHEADIVGRAHGGEEGLRLAAALNPDVIVLDISMPDISGFEVASRLRQRNFRPRIVMLTVHEDLEILRAARALGVLGYVLKRRIATALPTAVRDALADRPFVSPPLPPPE